MYKKNQTLISTSFCKDKHLPQTSNLGLEKVLFEAVDIYYYYLKQTSNKSDNCTLKRCIFTVIRDVRYTAKGQKIFNRPLNHGDGGQHNGPRIERFWKTWYSQYYTPSSIDAVVVVVVRV